MSVATANYYSSVTAAVVSGGQWLPPVLAATAPSSAKTQDPMLHLDVPGLDFHLDTVLGDLSWTGDYSVVVAEAQLYPGLIILVTFRTQVVDEVGNLQIKELTINFEATEHRPRQHFLAASLYAMLPLAGPIRVVIPELEVDVSVDFSTSLRNVSTLLQSRQAYYGLMAIEKATGARFDVPEYISGDDMTALSFAYHAVTEQTFNWLTKFITLPVPATEKILRWFDTLQSIEPGGSVYKLMFGPSPASRTIFGQTVNLGPETVFVEDGVFQNREEVRRELALLDEHIVQIVVRPLSGMGKYELPHAPRLPNSPWDAKIEAFVKLEDRLNERLADGYNELAASTLAGLTPEEIEVVTARPVLDDDALQVKE